MNEIKLKEIKKAWLIKSKYGKPKSYLYFFGEFEKNLFLKEKNRLRVKEIGFDYIVVDKELIVKVEKDLIEYFKDGIKNEEEISIKLNLNNTYKVKIRQAREEQLYAEDYIDVLFEEISEKEELYTVEIPENVLEKNISFEKLHKEIRQSFDKGYNIPEKYIKINIAKRKIIIEKNFMRKLTENILKKINKKLIFRDFERINIFENDKLASLNSGIDHILDFINKYDNFYTIIDYTGDNDNPIIKGMYIKSEIFNDKLYYIKIENLKNFLLERGLRDCDNIRSKEVENYLDSCLINKKAENF